MTHNMLTFPDGRVFLSHDSLVVGDYGGAGSVGAGNLKALRESKEGAIEVILERDLRVGIPYRSTAGDWIWNDYCPEPDTTMIEVLYDYSGCQAFILDTPDNREIIAALDDYPAINDETISEVEMTWESEAWDSWLRADLLCTLPDDYGTDENPDQSSLRDRANEIGDSDLFELYRQAMNETNTYPTPEYSGVHVDVDRIKDAFRDLVEEYLK